MDDRIREYFEKWKKQGKVRWAGITIHKQVKETTEAAIKTKFYRLVMPTLNQSSYESMQEEMRLAEQMDVGIMAMKTLRGLKGREKEQAFIKKLLSNPAVSTVNKGIDSFDKFDAYVDAAKKQLTSMEDKMLYRYAQATRSDVCMMCSECEGVCPQGIEISTMLRCSDYYTGQYNWKEHARMTMNEVPVHKRAHMCQDCGTCEEVCPNGLAIREHLKTCAQKFC
jgi:predicted aldo/keto reductase-like oxidoreductase